MHHVDTLSFCLAFHAIPEEERHMENGRLVFTPAHPVPISVFPNLKHVRVYAAPDRKMVPARLNCKWLDAFFFGKLQTITIYCPESQVHLDSPCASHQIIFRSSTHAMTVMIVLVKSLVQMLARVFVGLL